MVGKTIFAISARSDGKWYALYRDRDDVIVPARDALGNCIRCDSKALAHSVARYRRRRLRSWK